MCGIIAVKGNNVVNNVLSGLKKLEYRGYDSCGMACVKDGDILLYKQENKHQSFYNESRGGFNYLRIKNALCRYRRNKEMVDIASAAICFWDGKSKGTQYTLEYAKKQQKPITLLEI